MPNTTYTSPHMPAIRFLLLSMRITEIFPERLYARQQPVIRCTVDYLLNMSCFIHNSGYPLQHMHQHIVSFIPAQTY